MEPIAFEFNVADIDPFVSGGGTVPAGLYAVAISNMEVRENRGKNGHNLSCEYTITEGEFKGRRLYDNLNLWFEGENAEKTVEIAYRQLASIGHAVGVLAGADLTELANIVMLADIALDPAKPATTNPNTGDAIAGRPESNRFMSRSPYDESRLAGTAPAANAAPGAAAKPSAVNASKAAAAPGAPAGGAPNAKAAANAEPTSAKAPPPWKKAAA